MTTMKFRDMEAVAKAIAPHIKALAARLDQLESQIAGASAQTANLADAYDGVWRAGKQYQRGQLVTHKGSLWLAEVGSNCEPGTGSAWKMVSKNGKAPR